MFNYLNQCFLSLKLNPSALGKIFIALENMQRVIENLFCHTDVILKYNKKNSCFTTWKTLKPCLGGDNQKMVKGLYWDPYWFSWQNTKIQKSWANRWTKTCSNWFENVPLENWPQCYFIFRIFLFLYATMTLLPSWLAEFSKYASLTEEATKCFNC